MAKSLQEGAWTSSVVQASTLRYGGRGHPAPFTEHAPDRRNNGPRLTVSGCRNNTQIHHGAGCRNNTRLLTVQQVSKQHLLYVVGRCRNNTCLSGHRGCRNNTHSHVTAGCRNNTPLTVIAASEQRCSHDVASSCRNNSCWLLGWSSKQRPAHAAVRRCGSTLLGSKLAIVAASWPLLQYSRPSGREYAIALLSAMLQATQ